MVYPQSVPAPKPPPVLVTLFAPDEAQDLSTREKPTPLCWRTLPLEDEASPLLLIVPATMIVFATPVVIEHVTVAVLSTVAFVDVSSVVALPE